MSGGRKEKALCMPPSQKQKKKQPAKKLKTSLAHEHWRGMGCFVRPRVDSDLDYLPPLNEQSSQNLLKEHCYSNASIENLKAGLLGTVNKAVLAVSNLIFSKGYFLIY